MSIRASLTSLCVIAYIYMFVDAVSIPKVEQHILNGQNEKLLKGAICGWDYGKELFKEIKLSNRQQESIKNHGLDASSCKIGSMNFNSGPSTTILETVHLIRNNIKRGNECMKSILEANVE